MGINTKKNMNQYTKPIKKTYAKGLRVTTFAFLVHQYIFLLYSIVVLSGGMKKRHFQINKELDLNCKHKKSPTLKSVHIGPIFYRHYLILPKFNTSYFYYKITFVNSTRRTLKLKRLFYTQ